MTTKAAVKKLCLPHTNSRLRNYLKEEPIPKVSLADIQRSLSNIGISLSKRVLEDRHKR